MDEHVRIAPVPSGSILLHIGPYKTGSTAIQSAMFAKKAELAAHGVAYPGRWRRLFRQGHALMGWAPRGFNVPPVKVWDDFAAEVRAITDQTVCLSTEDFGRLRQKDRARKIVEDLGADRLHVLVVARAYHRVLPSHWQERVKSHEELDYDAWLRVVLGDDSKDSVNRAFWMSHDVEWMLSRWSDFLPPERFTFILTDDSDRGLITRTFEQMLGLPDGLLRLDSNSNASLSHNAIEVLRSLNAEFSSRGWSDKSYTDLVQRGMVRALQDDGPFAGDVKAPALPEWAIPLVAERSRRRVQVLRESGVNLVGDLDQLLLPESYLPGRSEDVVQISVAAAAAALAGTIGAALESAEADRKALKRVRSRQSAPVDLTTVSGRELLREVSARAKRRALRR